MRRAENATVKEAGQSGELRFLHIEKDAPKDLARAFRAGAKIMPRARLGDGSWQLEDDALAALRAKIKGRRKTLSEVYGPPLYGIKTGLNEAFIVSSEQRDALVNRDPRSVELLVPFLRGENIKRWRVESEGLFLINIPRGKVRIDDYPAIRDHLLAFKPALEARATKQEWFELQQSQLAFQDEMKKDKVIWPQIICRGEFCLDTEKFFPINKAYFFQSSDHALVGYLNAKLIWFYFASFSVLKSGGFREATAQHISLLPDPEFESSPLLHAQLKVRSETCALAAGKREQTRKDVIRRFQDLCPRQCTLKTTEKLRQWWTLDFKAFQAEIKKAFKANIPLAQRNEWDTFLREEGDKVRHLTAEIEKAEREIDRLVYELFNLAPEEIALLESALAGQY